MADGDTPAEGDTGAADKAASEAQGTPWFQGGDAELVGHLQNRGLHEKTAVEAAFELARAHREAEKFIGAPADQLVRMPKDPADVAGLRAVYTRLGAPADAAGYDFAEVKRADGTAPDASFIDAMRATAAELMLPKDAAARVATAVVKYEEGRASAKAAEADAARLQQKAALEASWGSNLQSNTFIADQAAAKLGIKPETLAAMRDSLGGDGVMQLFLKIGQSMGEDRYVNSNGQPGVEARTVEQAVADKKSLQGDKAFVERFLKGDAEAVRQMKALDIIISGEGDQGYRAA